MSRPTNIYPERPRLEHFLASPTGLKAFTGSPPNTPGGAIAAVASSFQKLNEAGYAAYLAAHTTWLNALDSVDQLSHEHALRKRALEKYREVPVVIDAVKGDPVSDRRQDIQIPHYPGKVVRVRSDLKEEHPPVLSTQPHQVEKRANKKLARDARVKVQANVYKAKAELLLEKTVPVLKEHKKAVEDVTVLTPLRKAEEAAAKSAVVRAAAITRSSKDLVTEVKPDDGWKLVTRKKGDYRNEMSQLVTVQGGVRNTVTMFRDPAVPLPQGQMLPVRQPNSVGAKS